MTGRTLELQLGPTKLLRVQRVGDVVRLTTGQRIERAVSSAVLVGGTVSVPLRQLPAVLRTLRQAAR